MKRDKGGFSRRLPLDPRRTRDELNVLEVEVIKASNRSLFKGRGMRNLQKEFRIVCASMILHV